MTFKFRHLEKIVGFFMLFGIIILLVAVIFMGREQKWFEKSVILRTTFNDGEGLTKGMDVKINGLLVGKVAAVGFASNNNLIDVQFRVYSDFVAKVRRDSYVIREASSPLGGGNLGLTIGTMESEAVKNGDFLLSEDAPEVQTLIAKGIVVKKGSLDAILKNVNLLLAQLASPQGPLIGTLQNVQNITAGLAGGQGTIGALLADRSLFNSIAATLDTVRKISEDFNVLSGTLRASSPNIRNLITTAERGLAETTKVLVGLQSYFMVQSQRVPGANTTADPVTVIRTDRRNESY